MGELDAIREVDLALIGDGWRVLRRFYVEQLDGWEWQLGYPSGRKAVTLFIERATLERNGDEANQTWLADLACVKASRVDKSGVGEASGSVSAIEPGWGCLHWTR